MIMFVAPAGDPTPWWQTVLTTLPGQFLTAVLAFAGVLLTLRHARKLQNQKADAEDRARQVETERSAVAKLLVTLQPWISSIANWGVAYEKATPGAASNPVVHRMHDDYTAAARDFSEALAIARVTVRNPAARPPLEALSEQRGIMTNLVSLAMVGKPESGFPEYYQTCHEVIAKSFIELEEAVLNWDGTMPKTIPAQKTEPGRESGVNADQQSSGLPDDDSAAGRR